MTQLELGVVPSDTLKPRAGTSYGHLAAGWQQLTFLGCGLFLLPCLACSLLVPIFLALAHSAQLFSSDAQLPHLHNGHPVMYVTNIAAGLPFVNSLLLSQDFRMCEDSCNIRLGGPSTMLRPESFALLMCWRHDPSGTGRLVPNRFSHRL